MLNPKRNRAMTRTFIVGTAATISLLAMAAMPSPRMQAIPTNPQTTCTVSPAMFASWFETGTPTLNGVVKPADGITFPNVPNCSFYQWSEQMFLWLTSPAPRRYGGGGRIFSSSTFYDVTPPDPVTGKRSYLPHVNGRLPFFNVRSAQVGPNKLPVIVDKRGRLFEVEPTKRAPSGKQLLRSGNRELEVERVTLDTNRKLVFQDSAGKILPKMMPILRPQLDKQRLAQKVLIDKKPVFLDASGNVIDTEEGQADGGALVAQNGSLVYYTTIVNDVYAYFQTGTKNGGITPAPTKFPTTQADLNKIVAYAATKGKTFPDPEALAVELKTAWVETTGLANPGSYITMKATVPTYDTSDPAHWVPNGQKDTTLALVGMHVVGSVKGHPEMIWASFEHFGNSPNAAYTFNATAGPNPKTVPQTTAGTWLFCASNSAGPFNQMRQSASGADIQVNAPFTTIGPSDVRRDFAFGKNSASSNTELIAINNSVLSQLLPGDIRANYFMLGATWTIGGASPSGANQVGTNKLSNTTMETFQPGSNCFDCHGSNTTSVSHVFDDLKPLFP